MSEILAASWRPRTYSRSWIISPANTHSRSYAHTFIQAPKSLVLCEIGPRKFLLCAFTTLTAPKTWIANLSSSLILLRTCTPSTPPPSWPLLFCLFFAKFTKSGANFVGAYLSGEKSESYFKWDLGIVYWWLSTVAIVANYTKVADFHCGP